MCTRAWTRKLLSKEKRRGDGRKPSDGAHLLSERRLSLLSLEDSLKASALLRIQWSHPLLSFEIDHVKCRKCD